MFYNESYSFHLFSSLNVCHICVLQMFLYQRNGNSSLKFDIDLCPAKHILVISFRNHSDSKVLLASKSMFLN